MTPKQAALQRLEAAIAGKSDPEHAHGSQGLSAVAAQDVVLVGLGLTDPLCVSLVGATPDKGARGATAGLPADAEAVIVMQKTWQVRHLIETAKKGQGDGPAK